MDTSRRHSARTPCDFLVPKSDMLEKVFRINDEPEKWNCSWKDGTIVGLAANIDTGMIAVLVDGSWDHDKEEVGLAFQNELIKKGVFPCFTAYFKLRYAFSTEDLKHTPPPDSVWKDPSNKAIALLL